MTKQINSVLHFLAVWGLLACGDGNGATQKVNQDAVDILTQPAEVLISPSAPTFLALRRVVAVVIGVDEATLLPSTTLDQLQLTGGRGNPDFLETIIQLENEFSVSISEEEWAKVTSLSQLCQLIDRLPKKEVGQ